MPNIETEKLIKEAYSTFSAGELPLAADLCKKILKIEANNIEAINLFAAILTKGGLYEQAINVLEQSLLLGGPDSVVLFNYGFALRGAGHLIRASRAFKNAAEANPNWADCWFNLGKTYRLLGNHSNSINALQKAIH